MWLIPDLAPCALLEWPGPGKALFISEFLIAYRVCICNVGRIMDDRDQAWSPHVWRVKEKRSVGVPDKKQIAE